MKYKVQHLGRNNLQYETSKGTTGSQTGFKRSRSYRAKWGKDIMPVYA